MSFDITRLIGDTGRINGEQCKKLSIQDLQQLSDCVPFCSGSLPEKIYLIRHKLTDMPTCICGNTLPFKNFVRGYQTHCSSKCARIDPLVISKLEATNIEKYGAANPITNAEVQAKQRQTMLDRYGVTNPQQSVKIQLKTKTTNLQRYGSENPLGSSAVQSAVRQTVQEKYGADNIMHSSVGVERVKATFLKKYGMHPSSTPEGKQKLSDTHNLKYLNSETFSDRILRLKKYHGLELLSNKTGVFSWSHMCGTIFDSDLNSGKIPICPRCCFNSRIETELIAEITTWKMEFEANSRGLISPQEVDVWIPEKNLAIEMDGFYWHSDEFKQPMYHLKKTIDCERLGVQLIHIFEDEWDKKREIVLSRLQHRLGHAKIRIFGRQCTIKSISKKQANDFCDDNHIQGACMHSFSYGLMYEGKLVSIMTFGTSRFRNDVDWEMLRFCSALDTSVVGGAEKLFSHFIKTDNPHSVVSYADRRWSQGNVYNKLGFVFEKNTRPNYWYVKGNTRYNRIKFQKHKLQYVLQKFDGTLTEKENMRQSNYQIIYDCGNMVFIWKK